MKPCLVSHRSYTPSSTKVADQFYNLKIFFNTLILMLSISACSTFKNSNNNTDNIPTPPQKINATSAAMPVVNANNKNNSSGTAKSGISTPKDRIQEIKGPGGQVDEVKVNNINNVPAYYIYPNKSGVDANAPSSDMVSTPSWKISW